MQLLKYIGEMFIDKYVGKAKVIVDRSEKKDHQILEIVKPKRAEPTRFTPNDFRLPDTVNNHMFYQYESWAQFISPWTTTELNNWCCNCM